MPTKTKTPDGQDVFIWDPDTELARKPRAALSVMVLNPERSFELSDYILGRTPMEDDVAVMQTLVSA